MAQATDDAEARATAQRGLSQLTSALDQQASATERAAKVQRASTMLQADPVSEGAASQAFTLLEEARVAGYDANLVAFYYAKALNVMGRSADAIPYAQTAVDASDGQARPLGVLHPARACAHGRRQHGRSFGRPSKRPRRAPGPAGPSTTSANSRRLRAAKAARADLSLWLFCGTCRARGDARRGIVLLETSHAPERVKRCCGQATRSPPEAAQEAGS